MASTFSGRVAADIIAFASKRGADPAGLTDLLGLEADSTALTTAWDGRRGEALAELLDGDAFRSDFASARAQAAALLRALLEHHAEETGRYLLDVRDGRATGIEPAEFEKRFDLANLLPESEPADE